VKNYVKVSERGRRIGESHPRAVLTDHEVALIFECLEERETMIAVMTARGASRASIDAALNLSALSYARLSVRFDVCKSCIAKIATGERRCQTIARVKPVPVKQ